MSMSINGTYWGWPSLSNTGSPLRSSSGLLPVTPAQSAFERGMMPANFQCLNATEDGFKEVHWRPEAHQIPNARVTLERGNGRVDGSVALLWGFVPRQTAKVDAVKRK